MPGIPYQMFDVPLAKGLNTRDDDKTLPAAKLLDLQNSHFRKGNSLRKRNGYTDLTQSIVGGGSVAATKALATRNDELVLLDGDDLYGYSETRAAWSNRGAVWCMNPSVTPAAQSTEDQIRCDMGTAAGITVYAWENEYLTSTRTVKYAVYDAEGVLIQATTSLGDNLRDPRVLVIGTVILIMVHDTSANDIKIKRIDTADLTTSLASSLLALGYSDIEDGSTVDAVSTGTYAVFACRVAGSNLLRVGTVTSAGALGVNGTGFGTAATGPTAGATGSYGPMAIDVDPVTNRGLVVWQSNHAVTGRLYVVSISNIVSGSGAITFGTAFNFATSANGTNRVSVIADQALDSGRIWWEDQVTAVPGTLVSTSAYAAGALTGSTTTRYNTCLASHAFRVGSDYYVNVNYHNSELQATHFLVNTDWRPHARVNYGTAYTVPDDTTSGHLPRVTGATTLEWASSQKRSLVGSAEPGLVRIQYALSAAVVPQLEHRGLLYVGVGLLWQYDGESPTEVGFLLLPEFESITPSNGSGTLTSSSTYGYAAYWEWFDALGNRVFSATAEIESVTLGASDDTVTLLVRTLPFTWKQGARTAAHLALYRTAANGVLRYRVSDSNPAHTTISAGGYYVANNPAAQYITYEDRMPDSTLTSRALDPHNPNDAGLMQIDNVAPPALVALHRAQDRLWGVSAEDPSRVYYTKLPQAETAPEWSDGLYIELPEDCTAVADVGGRLLFFSAEHIYIVDGEGPDNNGQGSYSRVEQLPSEFGLYYPGQLVECPAGWIFLSRQGWRILGGNLQVGYVGSDVESYNGQTFTGATLVPVNNEVNFLTSSGRTLSFDYERGIWSSRTGHTGVASVLWKGVYCYATSAGVVRKETAGTYSENATTIAQLAETGWIAVPGTLQGRARCRRAIFTLTYKSPHTVTVEVAYNHVNTYTQSVTINPADFVSGVGDSYRARIRMTNPKCTAIKFRITEVPGTGADVGEGLEINALSLEIGSKSGSARLAENRSL